MKLTKIWRLYMDDDEYQTAEEDLWSEGIDATDDMVYERMEEERRNS